jgi:hypothetical protein
MKLRRVALLALPAAAVGIVYAIMGGSAPPGACCAPLGPVGGPPRSAPRAGVPLDAPALAAPAPPAPSTLSRPAAIKVVRPDGPDTRGYVPLDFGVLGSFVYETRRPWELLADRGKPEGERRSVIPRGIRRLSGRRVVLEGFMMPLDYDETGVGEFILNGGYDMCAFGAPTRVNEWVLVRMKDGGRTRFSGHFPILVYGRIEVGEVWRGDQLDSLYRLEADFIGIPGAMSGS